MKIAISGTSGFLGKYLKNRFLENNFEVMDITRNDFLDDTTNLSKKIDGSNIIINLVGAPIINRWTKEYKRKLYDSRIDTTKKIVDSISLLENKPKLFINASAIGIYKDFLNHDEYSNNIDNGFLGDLVRNWEKEALNNEKNCRTIIMRFAPILGKNGGFLEKMLPIFKLGFGGKIGNGNFYMNFVDIDDIYNFIIFSINNEKINGIFNLSNISITNKDFTKILAKVVNKPAFIPVPKFGLYLLYGEGAKVIYSNMQVRSSRSKENGFEFKNDNLETILKEYI